MIWLCANNRVQEAEQIIRNAAKMNRLELPEHLLTQPSVKAEEKCDGEEKNGGFFAKIKSLKGLSKTQKKDQPEVARYTLLHVFRHRLLRMYAIIMSCLWYVSD